MGPIFDGHEVISTIPGGIFPASSVSLEVKPPISLALTCATATATYVALLTSYVYRFGKLKNAEVRSRQTAAHTSEKAEWLSSPWQSPATAILWKQFRESGPIALTGIAVCAGITLIAVLISLFDAHLTIPEAIGEDYNVVGARLKLFWSKQTAECGSYSEHRKEIGRAREAEQTFG